LTDDYKQAMKDVINLLMIQHEVAKGSHNYWHVAANLVRAEFLQDRDTSEKCVQKSEEIRREWVGLTDEEIDELYGSPMELEHSGALKWVRVIEAKLKEKNT